MKLTCLIVINPFSTSKSLSDKALRIKEELQKKGVDADIKGICDLPIVLKDSKATIQGMENYSFCIYLDKDKYIDQILEAHMPVFNSHNATEYCDDKALTYIKTLGIPVCTPKTIPAPLCYTQPNPIEVKKFLDFVEKELGYPLVCKEAYGSLGKQVYLLKNREELNKKYLELSQKTHLYQEYVGTNIHQSEDYRLITIGGKLVAWMKRVNKHDFRSNIALGGQGIKVTSLPTGLKQASEIISQKLGLDYGGIDLLIGKNNKIYFLEANSNAFFEEIEKVSGINIAKLFVGHCLKKVKEQGLISKRGIAEKSSD